MILAEGEGLGPFIMHTNIKVVKIILAEWYTHTVKSIVVFHLFRLLVARFLQSAVKTIYLSLSSLSWYMMGTLGDVIQDVFLDL